MKSLKDIKRILNVEEREQKGICIIGLGGHSKVIKDIIASLNVYRIVAYLDDKFTEIKYKDKSLWGPISLAKELQIDSDIKFIIAIGDNAIRKKIVEKLNFPNESYAILVHPRALISPSVSIGFGSVIMPGSIINANTILGKHVIVNTGAVVEHDNVIKDFAHISPSVTLTGTVKVDKGAHIGAGASIIPGIHIGSWSIVGAGSTVIDNVEPESKVVGTPAKLIK